MAENKKKLQLGENHRRVVSEGRRKLEVEIKALLRDAIRVSELAFARARAARDAGASAVSAALVRIEAAEREVRAL